MIFSVFAATILITHSLGTRDPDRIISSIIYGGTLILLYTASTLYHGTKNKRLKYIFEILDHSSIYLLIAGTYTPFALITLKGTLGMVLLITVWCLAGAGVIFKIFFVKKFLIVSTLLYIAMGWIAIVAVVPLYRALPHEGFLLLLLGGLLYTFGTIFYVWRKISFHHAIWHIIVLAGSVSHFFVVLFYVLSAH